MYSIYPARVGTQSAVGRGRLLLKTHTEFVDIEFADLLIPLAHRDVEKNTQAPVSFTQEFLGWERIIETPRQGTFIHRRETSETANERFPSRPALPAS